MLLGFFTGLALAAIPVTATAETCSFLTKLYAVSVFTERQAERDAPPTLMAGGHSYIEGVDQLYRYENTLGQEIKIVPGIGGLDSYLAALRAHSLNLFTGAVDSPPADLISRAVSWQTRTAAIMDREGCFDRPLGKAAERQAETRGVQSEPGRDSRVQPSVPFERQAAPGVTNPRDEDRSQDSKGGDMRVMVLTFALLSAAGTGTYAAKVLGTRWNYRPFAGGLSIFTAPKAENRVEPRHKCSLPVMFQVTGSWWPAELVNISTKGAAIAGVSRMSRGDEIDIAILSHRVTAHVTWSGARTFGVVFDGVLDKDTMAHFLKMSEMQGDNTRAAQGRARPSRSLG